MRYSHFPQSTEIDVVAAACYLEKRSVLLS